MEHIINASNNISSCLGREKKEEARTLVDVSSSCTRHGKEKKKVGRMKGRKRNTWEKERGGRERRAVYIYARACDLSARA